MSERHICLVRSSAKIALVILCKSQLVVLFQNFIYLFIYLFFIFLLSVWFCVFLGGLFSMIVKLPNQKRPQRILVICIFISESTVNVFGARWLTADTHVMLA